MKSDLKPELPRGVERSGSLTGVLGKSEHVRTLVEECVEELSSVNIALKQQVADRDPPPGVEDALEKSEAVEIKVQEASEKLAVVNRALESEVRDRQMLDHQFAAVTEQEHAARHAALHDVLTGLPNRVLFNDRLEHGLALAKRHGWTVAVMFIDLDNFKIINDTNGHDAGDRVLQTIAGRLKENTRGDDTVSRLGGDEFLYLLMEIRDEKSVALVAEKLMKTIQAPCDFRVRDIDVSVSVKASIGIAMSPGGSATAESLVNNADAAMYRAKREASGYSFAP